MHLLLQPQPEWLSPQPSALFSFTGFRGHITSITLPRRPGYTLGVPFSPHLCPRCFCINRQDLGDSALAEPWGLSRPSLYLPVLAFPVHKQKLGQAAVRSRSRGALTLCLEGGSAPAQANPKKPHSESTVASPKGAVRATSNPISLHFMKPAELQMQIAEGVAPGRVCGWEPQ